MLLVAVLLLCGAGCSAASKDSGEVFTGRNEELAVMEYSLADVGGVEAPQEAGEVVSRPAGGPDGDIQGSVAGKEQKRYVILHARLTLEIEDVKDASGIIQERVRELGGYLESLEFYDLRDDRRAGQLAVRVPEHKFDYFLESLEDLGKVKNPHLYTDDVTMRYIDLEARLKNLDVQEERMRELLERAKNVEEILQIEKELGRIRGDLEAMSAEFKYLRERVSYSTVEIRLEEKDPQTVAVSGGVGSFAERIGHLLVLNTNRLLRGASNFFIVLIGSLPLLVPLCLLAYLAWKAVQFLRARKKRAINHRDNFPS